MSSTTTIIRGILVVFVLTISSCASKKTNYLTKKYPATALREDAELFKNVTLKMHPVLGIFNSKQYYSTLFDNYIASIKDSLTEKEFRLQLKLIVDDLHCGHTEAVPSQGTYKELKRQKLNYSPYVFIPVGNKLFLAENDNKKKDSVFTKASEIVTINGIAADSIIRHSKKYISTDGYNKTAKDFYLRNSFAAYHHGLFGRPDTFTVQYLKNGQMKSIKYPAVKLKTGPLINLKPKTDSLLIGKRKSAIKFRFLDEQQQTAVLKIERFSNKGYKKSYRRFFRKIKKQNTQNLVIDLRNNGGGSIAHTYRLLSYLMDSTTTQSFSTVIKNYPYRKYVHGNFWFKVTRQIFKMVGKKTSRNDTDFYVYKLVPRKKWHYNNKLFVLINGGSFSASCLTSAYLKYHNRATLIGQETGGTLEGCNAGLMPLYRLPNTGIRIRMPAFRIKHDVSPAITGHGIMPDYEINYSLQDFLQRKDLELEKVQELLNKNSIKKN